jgi:hypothetical protein
MALPSRRNQTQRLSVMGRERSGLDTMFFDEQFQGSTINTSQWKQSTSTMTIVQSNGLTLNNGADTTSGDYAILQSYAGAGISGAFPTYFHFVFSLNQVPVANQVTEVGAGFVATNAAPTDGIFLRLNGTAVQLVVNANGTETITTVDTTSGAGFEGFSANTRYRLEIEAYDDYVAFYLGSLGGGYRVLGFVDSQLNVTTNANSWPLVVRTYNSGVPSAAQKVVLYRVTGLYGDGEDGKPWPHVAACAGWGADQGRTGSGTVGQTAQWANSAQPSSAALSNTAAGYTTFGGKYQFATVAGAETDYVLFGFQNPAGTATVPGAQLHITGIRISSINTGAAVATTATVLEWAAAVGSTAVSLATAQSATAKAPCRTALGCQGFIVGAAIGTAANDIDHQFLTPLVCNPAEFLQIIMRTPIGTATASQVIRGTVDIDGYYD